jgi:hypothetical protein
VLITLLPATLSVPAKWGDTQIVTAPQFLDAVAEIPEELR